MKDTIILNFANNVGRYLQMQQRLENSLRAVGYTGEIGFYNHEEHIRLADGRVSPYHASEDLSLHAAGRVVPYAFKAYAIKKAVEEGYKKIVWMDSAVYATKPLDEFFNHLERIGVLFFDNIGFSIGDYTSDACLKHFNWTRQTAFKNKMIMACLMAFDVESWPAYAFIEKYFEAANDGISFKGPWHNNNGEASSDMRVKGHRHDQSVASILITDMGLPVLNAQNTYFAYASHKGALPISDSVCLWSEGL